MSLLTGSSFHVRIGETDHYLSLPEVLERLGQQEPLVFCRIQTHQEGPWAIFLASLGAVALHRAGFPDVAQSAAFWRKALVELADGHETAFELIVDDLTKPAFCQFPVEDNLAQWNSDVSVESFEVFPMLASDFYRRRTLIEAFEDHMVYALVSAQLSAGTNGPYYTVGGRLNSKGRMIVSAWPGYNNGRRFKRDVELMLQVRSKIVATGMAKSKGIVLPWLSKKRPEIKQLDPYFLDTALNLRIARHKGVIRFYQKASKNLLPYVSSDFWAPIQAAREDTDESNLQSMRLSGFDARNAYRAFDYRDVHRILFEGTPPYSLLPHPDDDESTPVLLEGVIRDKAQTHGFQRRILHIPIKAWKSVADETQSYAAYSEQMIEFAKALKDTIYGTLKKLGLVVRNQGKEKMKSGAVGTLTAFSQYVSEAYPTRLFIDKHPPEGPIEAWRVELVAKMDELYEICREWAVSPQHAHDAEAFYKYEKGKLQMHILPEKIQLRDNLDEEQVTAFCRRLSGWLSNQSSGALSRMRRLDSQQLNSAEGFQVTKWLLDIGLSEEKDVTAVVELASMLAAYPDSYHSEVPFGRACGRARITARRFSACLSQPAMHLSSVVRILASRHKKFDWGELIMLQLATDKAANTVRRRINYAYYEATKAAN